jgi:hypothetical protein
MVFSLTSTLAMTTKFPATNLSSTDSPPITPNCFNPQLTACHGVGIQVFAYMLFFAFKNSASGTSSFLSTASCTTAPRARGRPYSCVCSDFESSSPVLSTKRSLFVPAWAGIRPALDAAESARSQALAFAWYPSGFVLRWCLKSE